MRGPHHAAQEEVEKQKDKIKAWKQDVTTDDEEDIFEEEIRSHIPTESVQSFGSMNYDGRFSGYGSFEGDIMDLNNNMMKARSDTMFQK